MVFCDVLCECCAHLRDGLNSHNTKIWVDCASQNRVHAAVCTHVNEAPGALDIVKYYGGGLLLPHAQARPKYELANRVELGGKPSALPSASVYCKRLKYPTPREEPSHLTG